MVAAASQREKKKKKKEVFFWDYEKLRDKTDEDFILFELGFGAGLGWQCFRGETKINNLTFLRLGMKYEVLFWANFCFI